MVVRLRHVLGWLAVVVVTAVVTTVIVTSVGRDVTDSVAGGSVALPPGLVGASTPTPPASVEPESGDDLSTPGSAPGASSPRGSSTTAVTGRAGASTEAEGLDGATADASGGAAGPGGSPSGAPRDARGGIGVRSGSTAAGTPAADGSSTRTFSTPGGATVAGCRGGGPYARSVTPGYGWSFETETEAGELDVTFKQPGQEYQLHVVCRSGQPVLAEGYGSEHR